MPPAYVPPTPNVNAAQIDKIADVLAAQALAAQKAADAAQKGADAAAALVNQLNLNGQALSPPPPQPKKQVAAPPPPPAHLSEPQWWALFPTSSPPSLASLLVPP